VREELPTRDHGQDMPPSTPSAAGFRVRSPLGALRRFARMPGQMLHKMSDDRIFGMSAEAGFWGLVSLPSLLLAVFGCLGYLSGVLGHDAITRVHNDVLRGARDVLSPTTVNDDVAPLVKQILDRGHAGVVSISFLISLWSGSSCTSAYLNTITVAYGMRGLRGAVRSRIIALGLYLLAVLAGIIILPALILGPDAIADLAPSAARSDVSAVVGTVYWPGLIIASVLVLATLYRVCLPVRVRWRAHLPGAVLAMLIWLGGSIGVRAYMVRKLRTGDLYGALGAPLAALLFFYVTALAVLLGAELNAVLRAELDPQALERAGVAPAPAEGEAPALGALTVSRRRTGALRLRSARAAVSARRAVRRPHPAAVPPVPRPLEADP
jgi:membrane protein